jgi:KDO2-lipid IV(A) lauroyltransferase
LYSSINLFLIRLLTLLVPRFLFPPFAFLAGGIVYLLLGKKRRIFRANLRIITGRRNVERLLFSTLYKYSLNWTDVMLMIRLRGKELDALIGRRVGKEYLDAAMARGRGAILISPHLGNWELGGLGLAEMGYPVNVLTFREPDEQVNELRERVRSERGIRFIYVDRHDTSPLAIIEAVNALRRNEILALLGDRDGSSHTAPMEFFGLQADIPLGAAYLGLASGAPVFPVFVPREGSRYATIMEEPVWFSGGHGSHKQVIEEGTARILRVFERYIRAYPDQWYNFFDYWGVMDGRKKDTTCLKN